jgi:tetratricopeptide (TPR) repeat protein
MAQQRLRQLPHSREELREQRTPRTLRLPGLKDPLDETPSASTVSPSPAGLNRARQLVSRLEQRPEDTAVREELAYVLADQLGNFTQAVEQIELLLGNPASPPNKVPSWLAQLAAWNLHGLGKQDAARIHLERLVREFPDTPQALTARRRLAVLLDSGTPPGPTAPDAVPTPTAGDHSVPPTASRPESSG